MGCTVTEPVRSPISSRSSRWVRTKVIASTTSMPLPSSASAMPSVQLAASTITGRRPPSLAAPSTVRTRSRICSFAPVMPLEEKGVPQHSDAASSGTAKRVPALWARRFSAAGTPSEVAVEEGEAPSPHPQLPPQPPPLGSSAAPNMVCTQAGRYTAATSAEARPRPPARRTEPPRRGSSGRYCGTASAPSSARPTSVAARGSSDGTAPAAPIAADAPRVSRSHCPAAALQPAFDAAPASSARRRRTRSPVLMSTGQVVTHIPSTAQVCSPSYS